MTITENAPLKAYTTIKLGGSARYLIQVDSIEGIKESILFAKQKSLRFILLGGGSNIIFPDGELNAVVIKIELSGISIDESGCGFAVMAGENWDKFVELTVGMGLQGVECLSGIPGLTGATPVQNVGAYGQEVSDVITRVDCINVNSLEEISFSKDECNFSYRSSKFKTSDRNKFIITSVHFKLSDINEPLITYKDLQKAITQQSNYSTLSRKEKLSLVRNEVINIRKAKSMVIDVNDPDSVSCGSFFMNPMLSKNDFEKFMSLCESKQLTPPYYVTDSSYKIPAAWLIENSGFSKGYTENGAGISNSHTLALVNRGCTQTDILNLSEKIKHSVKENFGIILCEEVVSIK